MAWEGVDQPPVWDVVADCRVKATLCRHYNNSNNAVNSSQVELLENDNSQVTWRTTCTTGTTPRLYSRYDTRLYSRYDTPPISPVRHPACTAGTKALAWSKVFRTSPNVCQWSPSRAGRFISVKGTVGTLWTVRRLDAVIKGDCPAVAGSQTQPTAWSIYRVTVCVGVLELL